jgi:hypothetical protein
LGPVNADAAVCIDCGMLAGEDAICCTMPKQGTPPRPESAAAIGAIGLNNGTAKKAPAVPKVMMTRRFLVRDMVVPSLSAYDPGSRTRRGAGLTEPTVREFADATIPELHNRCEGEADPSPRPRRECQESSGRLGTR